MSQPERIGQHFRHHVNQPADIDDVVRRVEDAACTKVFAMTIRLQLVVGGISYDFATKFRDRCIVQDSAKRAGGEDVRLRFMNPIRLDDFGVELTGGMRTGIGIQI